MIKKEQIHKDDKGWQLNRRVSLSFLVQLVFLASLIISSWVNLQRQLDLLQKDVGYLCDCQKEIKNKLDMMSEKTVAHEYRLRTVERQISQLYKPELKGGK
ncbi:MAG: hypothetical protein ACYSUK_04310 [Planctomycetota bacterium]